MVITFNEAPNLARCLDRLRWAQQILIIDSGSTDGTLEIARGYAQAVVLHRRFDDFASQCNFGLTQIASPWVLSLDADYELSLDLVEELGKLEVHTFSAYEASFVYRIYGRSLRGTLYPPRKVLYLRERAKYENKGHGHRVIIDGTVGSLRGRIYHDDRKPLSGWFASQLGYARHEASYLLSADKLTLRPTDRIRASAWLAPVAVFVYTLIWKGCLLDGWPGWLYVLQRTIAEMMISLEIVDRHLSIEQANNPRQVNTPRSHD